MSTLLATSISLQLFAPLLVASTLTLAVMLLGRHVALRKFTRALGADDSSPQLSTEAFIVETPKMSSSVTFRPREHTRVTAPRESLEPEGSELTRRFVRPHLSPADSAAMTLRARRVYLDAGDIIEC